MAGFFRQLLGRDHGEGEVLPSANLRRLYETHAGLSRERQFALEEFLQSASGDGDWRVSLHSGTISLQGERYVYPIQFLGTRSDLNNTWLWAWADRGRDQPAVPLEFLASVNQLRARGAKDEIMELTSPGFELGSRGRQVWFDVHFLGQLACALCHADCYAGVPYPGGEMLVLFNAPEVIANADPRLLTLRMTGFFTLVGSFLPVDRFDHRKMVAEYVRQKGHAGLIESERKIECTVTAGDRLVVEFDNAGRIASCSIIAIQSSH